MCYAAPGPRCSSFAKKALTTAHAALTDANRVHAHLLEQARTAGSGRFEEPQPDPDLARAYRACQEAEQALWRARADYDATPSGIADLKIQAARLEDRLGFEAAHDDPAYRRVISRIDDGRARRDEQLRAYKAALSVPSPVPTAAVH